MAQLYIGLSTNLLPIDPAIRAFMEPEEVFVRLLEERPEGRYLARIAEQPEHLEGKALELELSEAQVQTLMVYKPGMPSYQLKEQLVQAQLVQPYLTASLAPAHETHRPHVPIEIDQVEHFSRESVMVPLPQKSEQTEPEKVPANLPRYFLRLALDHLKQVRQAEVHRRERKALKARVYRIRGLLRFGLQGVLPRLLDIIPIYGRGAQRDNLIALRVDIDIPALA